MKHGLGVRAIKRQHLVEIRTMSNPPLIVKNVLESVCLLLGETVSDWKVLRGIIIKENFIPNIISFCSEDIT